MSRSHDHASRSGSHLDKVQQFVVYLYEHIREKNISEMRSMYTRSFYRLSEMYFKESLWPHVDEIADFVDNDPIFCWLYQELYYRHLYLTFAPSMEHRIESWTNYCRLFEAFLSERIALHLPNEWLWDMVDEFLYQFQAYHQFKGKTSQNTPEENEQIQSIEIGNEKIWNVLDVLNYLEQFVERSGIEAYLHQGGEIDLFQKEGYQLPGNVPIVMGYVSLIGLSRIYVLVGDYGTALHVLTPLKIHEPKTLFARKIPGAFVSLFYYVTFTYLMMRRYVDANKSANVALLYFPTAKELVFDRTKLHQLEVKEEQMFQILAILVALCPRIQKQYLDDRLSEKLMDSFADKVQAMRRGSVHVFDELFSSACPRFINTDLPDLANGHDTNQDAYQNQRKLFLDELKQNVRLPELFQYMNLYSSISLEKLAALLDTDLDSIRTQLMCIKNKHFTRIHEGDPDLLSGNFQYSGMVDFYLDVDLKTGVEYLMIQDGNVKKSHAQTMIRHIHKFKDIMKDLKTALPTPTKHEGTA